MNSRKICLRMISLVCVAGLLTGCGAAENAEETAPVETAENEDVTSSDDTGMSAEEESGTAGETAEAPEESGAAEKQAMEDLTPDPTNLEYLEEYQIADIYGTGEEYPLYAPKGGTNDEGLFFYKEHGVTFTATVYSRDSAEDLLAQLEKEAKRTAEFWEDDLACLNVSLGEVREKEDDRYLILAAEDKDSLGAPYQKTLLMYMSAREGNVGVFWDMQVSENGQDEETALLVGEVARCYGLDLSGFLTEDGTWAEQYAQRAADLRDNYEPEEGDPVLKKVEGYQYLGELTLTLDEKGKVTYPVLAPMVRSTEAEEDGVSAMVHGVYVQIRGGRTDSVIDIQEILQEDADGEVELRSDPELGNRNAQAGEVTPLPGQEEGAFYTLAYEKLDYGSEEYYQCAEITWVIRVQENYMVVYKISLLSMDYDNNTNGLIKELETAYGFDLSEWYAK